MALCRRNGARCLPQVQPLTQAGNTGLRKIGLRALASIGGHDALATVKSAMNDSDEAIQDEAVNLLSTWPNTWPEDTEVAEPLLALAKSGKKTSHQVQGLQGYLQYVEQDKKLTEDEKLAKLKELLPIAKTPEAKRQVVAVVGAVPTVGALRMATDLISDESVTEEACVTALKLATSRNLAGASRDDRRAALQTVAAKTQNDDTKSRANEALKRFQ
jgi:hypothetical protein